MGINACKKKFFSIASHCCKTKSFAACSNARVSVSGVVLGCKFMFGKKKLPNMLVQAGSELLNTDGGAL